MRRRTRAGAQHRDGQGMSKPLDVREYEADRVLWSIDPAFAAEVGVHGPMRPYFPPNERVGSVSVSHDWAPVLQFIRGERERARQSRRVTRRLVSRSLQEPPRAAA
jgi:hypothetical protein